MRPLMQLVATTMTMAALSATAAAAAVQTSPEVQYAKRETNLAEIAGDTVTTHPLRLYVQFSLNAPPGSPEAKAFLEQNMKVIRSMPQTTGASLSRLIVPATYDYLVVIDFLNWDAYRAYDTDPGFLDYYYKSWKPNVKSLHTEFLTLAGAEGVK